MVQANSLMTLLMASFTIAAPTTIAERDSESRELEERFLGAALRVGGRIAGGIAKGAGGGGGGGSGGGMKTIMLPPPKATMIAREQLEERFLGAALRVGGRIAGGIAKGAGGGGGGGSGGGMKTIMLPPPKATMIAREQYDIEELD